jgi:hypothetical protein
MEKMRKTEASKIVQEGVDIFFEEMKKGGCPIEVGRGDIRTDMGEIEKKLDIKACAPKIYFAWEEGEKMGLQLLPYKFVPKGVNDKMERQMDMVLKNR